MKKFLFIAILIVLMSALNAQVPMRYSSEPLLTPDSALTLQDGEYVRYLSGAELKREFDLYQAEKEKTSGAYTENVAPEKLNVIIPMAPETKAALVRQDQLFRESAVDFVDTIEMPRAAVSEQEFQTGYNHQWGKQETFAAYIDALLRIYGSKESRALDAHAYAGGYVFNYHARALEFTLEMRNGATPSAHTALKIFGQTKFTSSGTMVYKKMYFQDEVGKSVTFFIGPVPVSVRGSIGGSAGFDAGVAIVGTGIQGYITPAITSYGKADAGVDLWFVKAGVEGSLDLVNDNLPANVTVQLMDGGNSLNISLKATNNLKALSGCVVIFVQVKEFWKFWENSWKRYSTTLFSWNGYQNSWVLFDKTMSVQLK